MLVQQRQIGALDSLCCTGTAEYYSSALEAVVVHQSAVRALWRLC